MNRALWRYGWLVWLCLMCSVTQAKRVALLVGVSHYQQVGLPALEGVPHDVAAMRDVLIRRWGFVPGDVRTVLDEQATQARILEELSALVSRSEAGDEVLIYFSGHGTSALDEASAALAVPHGSGAFVAYDFDYERGTGLIVGRTDWVPRIQALEQGQRRVWIILDSCYSGQAARESFEAASMRWPVRAISLKPSRKAPVMRDRPPPPPYPYQATVVLAAAAEGEVAKDIDTAHLRRWPTLDGKPHGALTEALLQVLNGGVPGDLNRDGWLDLHEVHRAVTDVMAQRPYGQSPQRLPAVADDVLGLGGLPVLSVKGVAMPAQQGVPTALRVRGGGLPEALQQQLSGLPNVRWVARGAADVVLQRVQAEVAVWDAAGDRWAQWPLASPQRVVDQVRQLAWWWRVRQVAQQHQRGVLPMEIEPDGLGGNLLVGQEVSLVVRPPGRGWLVLINVGSDGALSPLYPLGTHQMVALPAGAVWRSPGQRVQPPEGKDVQLALWFEREPAELGEWVKLTRSPGPVERERMQAMLERMIVAESGRFVAGMTEFRTWAGTQGR